MPRFRKRPVEVEAVQWNGTNHAEIADFLGGDIFDSTWDWEFTEMPNPKYHAVRLDTLEGSMLARVGDWIIKGVQGEHYPCKPDIFAATYDEIE